MPITSDGIMNKTNDGFTKIESEEQLDALPDGFYFLWHDNEGKGYRYVKQGLDWSSPINDMRAYEFGRFGYSAFRHVPDAASVGNSGFKKKETFCGAGISALATLEKDWCYKDSIIKKAAQEVLRAYAEIDRQAATIARLDHIATDAQNELDKAVEEIAALQAPREWVAIESAEQLDALPVCLCEFKRPSGEIYAGGRSARQGYDFFYFTYKDEFHRGWNHDAISIDSMFSHYRLITRADDFAPPERKIKIGGAEYSREELKSILAEQGVEL